MGPLTLAIGNKNSSMEQSDMAVPKVQNLSTGSRVSFASVSIGEEKPFDFIQTLIDGIIAGGTAGVVVETALYPIDTIKTRLQTAGAVGGVAASLIRVPTEVVKQRMQTGQFASAPDAVRLIVAKEGFKGLYAGYRSFLLRDLPFDALQFCLYEQLRIGYKLAAKRELNDPENAVIGAFAGALTGAITTPLDVIKTRLMTQGSANQYNGIVDCLKTIVREEGAPALLKMSFAARHLLQTLPPFQPLPKPSIPPMPTIPTVPQTGLPPLPNPSIPPMPSNPLPAVPAVTNNLPQPATLPPLSATSPLPAMPAAQTLPQSTALPPLSAASPLPAMQTTPTLPQSTTLPPLPAANPLPTMPAAPTLPKPTNVSPLPATLPPLPSMPSAPKMALPPLPAMPTTIPTIPTMAPSPSQ